MISGLFIFNHKGEVLINRLYRTDIKIHVIASSSDVKSPINTLANQTFLHVRSENLFIVAVVKDNPNVAHLFEFLHKLVIIGKSYFNKFDEDSVKKIVDYGLVQNNDVETLKMYITTEGIKSEKVLKEESSKITIQTTGATSWRRQDIKYRKNEAYLDVIESINMLMSSKGAVLRSDVTGQIVMKTFLSGMPECKLGLNDKISIDKSSSSSTTTNTTTNTITKSRNRNGVELDDVQFHQCVKLGRFDTERSISFVPPDGEFELMRYRTTDNIVLPFKLTPLVHEHKTKVEYRISLKSCFNSALFAQGVVVRVPTPSNTARCTINVPIGKAKYAAGENALIWKIAKFNGDEEYILSAEAELSSMVVQKAWSRPPISMEFQVMMFTSSGLSVEFLKVFEKSNYKSVKWVRYYTKAGSFQFRF